jgi:hypothetical protein
MLYKSLSRPGPSSGEACGGVISIVRIQLFQLVVDSCFHRSDGSDTSYGYAANEMKNKSLFYFFLNTSKGFK